MKQWTKAEDDLFSECLSDDEIAAKTGRSLDAVGARGSLLESLSMRAWCAPGESVLEMLARSAKRD